MGSVLSEKQIIRLHHEMVVPVAVHEILAGRDDLDETARYALDVMVAEFDPDTALLCIAICAAHIAERHATYLPIAGTLGFEASRIVHEYGPWWLANIDQKLTRADERAVLDLLDHLPEDFEAMADLLDAVNAHLIETTDCAIIADILSQNARAFMDYLELQAQEDAVQQDVRSGSLEAYGNVIPFPRQHRVS